MKGKTKSRQRPWLVRLAVLCLVLSALSIAQAVIDDYNSNVKTEQFDRKMIANSGSTFSHDWGWGVNYPKRNRNLIFILSVTGLLFTVLRRTRLLALLAYGLTLPLIYQWITITVRNLSANELYMSDSPYLLRIATPLEWAFFFGLVVTFGVTAWALVRGVRS